MTDDLRLKVAAAIEKFTLRLKAGANGIFEVLDMNKDTAPCTT